MFDGYALQNNGGEWGFVNEEALENFLYRNLEQLLKIQPLERQYNVESQRCDILAVGDRQKLVVLELKNAEDRGIVQQLTRYYDALLGEKPFGDRVDYDKPVQLIAIAPSFHRDNFTDKKYHTLDFQFLQFSVIENQDQFYLCLRDVDSNTVSRVKIPYQKPPTDLELPPIPTALAKMMKNCEPYQQKILEIREKILLFDNRIQEISSANSIKYGNGKAKNSKFCAEFMSYQDEIILFLWIPYKMGESTRISRARIWTDWQDRALIEGYVSKEVGNKINRVKKNIQKIMDKIDQGWEFDCFHRTCLYGKEQRWSEKYIQELKNVSKKLNPIKPLIKEEIDLLKYHENLYRQQHQEAYHQTTTFKFELDGYDRSLQSLLDLALEKWSDRV